MRKTAILCLTQHWRLNDHPLLNATCGYDQLLIVYPFHNPTLNLFPGGMKRIGPFRLKFIAECLYRFNQDLLPHHQQIWVVKGTVKEVISQLLNEISESVVFIPDEPAYEEQQSISGLIHDFGKERVQTDDIGSLFKHQFGVLHPLECPEMFTQFRKAVEQKHQPLPVASPPKRLPPQPNSIPTGLLQWEEIIELKNSLSVIPDQRGGIPLRGGEKNALSRLSYYFDETDCALTYKETRNGLIGTDYSTRFSPYLATGSLSPRSIFKSLRNFEEAVEANESTYWIYFELLWREYFRVIARKHGASLFKETGMQLKSQKWSSNEVVFRQWCEGQTGQPFIDACMKELRSTGWLSNRGRQNAASYLVHHLKIDWRWGASWFEHFLIDYDAASNWGNWQYVAGIGQDPRGDRVFDPIRQSNLYDANGAYRKLWR